MLKKNITRILFTVVLVMILTMSIAPPALAFDGRNGKVVIIPENEVVNDDLYINGEDEIIINGTVKGDVVAFAKTIIINGTVEGDLIAAGQTIVINGTVKDDIRMAGAAFLIGEKASIGSDIIAAGASFEARPGSSIGKDIVYAGGQILMSGDVGRNMNIAAGAFELRGKVVGNVSTDVGGADSHNGGGPHSYMSGSDLGISIPDLKPGLTIDPAARISGKLDYTTTEEIKIPEGAVAGKVTHSLPQKDSINVENHQPEALTPVLLITNIMNGVMNGILSVVRNTISFILIGLLLVWLFPAFIKTTTERLKVAPLPSLGWGIVHIAAFFFALLILTIAVLIGAIAFGVLTLYSLSGAIIVCGLLLMFAIIIGFLLAVGFVAEIIVSILGGQMILARIKPALAEHKYWPLITGAIIYTILTAIPLLGHLLALIAVLLGLGAIWYFEQNLFTKKSVVA